MSGSVLLLGAIGVVWWASVAWWVGRDRDLQRLVLGAALVRWSTWSADIHLHVYRAYGLLLQALGQDLGGGNYGDGWGAVVGVAAAVAGWPADAAPLVHGVLGVLAVPLLASAVGQASSNRLAGLAAGSVLAVLPLHVALSHTETRFVLVATLQLAAVAGILRGDRSGITLAAASVGLLAHTRPVQAVVALGLWLWMGRRGARRALVVPGALIAWRWFTLLAGDGGMDAEGSALLFRLPAWRQFVGPDAVVPWFDPTRTPVGVVALAALGVWRGRDKALVPAVLGAAGVGLYASHQSYADALRFQLPAQVWLAGLAGIGVAHLARGGPGARLALVVAAITWWPARRPYPPFPWQVEHAVLRLTAAHVGQGDTVVTDESLDPEGRLSAWAEGWTGATWLPLSEGVDARWRFVGLADHRLDGRALDLDGWTPVATRVAEPAWADLEFYGPWAHEPLTVGLYRRE